VHDAVIGPGRANARSLTHGYCQKLVPLPLPPSPFPLLLVSRFPLDWFPFLPGLSC
jgi:hypothetical protein